MRAPLALAFILLLLSLSSTHTQAHAAAGATAWQHPLPVDHGFRRDLSGSGHFLASRYHGRHNGIDLLAPVGTPVLSTCAGKARSGTRGGFGRWVQLVCRIPSSLSGDKRMYGSVFYAHLEGRAVPQRWVRVKAGQKLGTVGKTGNAKAKSIQPHLHLEMIIHGSEKAAMAERHSGRNQATTASADHFFKKMRKRCLVPAAFRSKQSYRRARRADPFMVLRCLAADKPKLTRPAAALRRWAVAWSKHYRAKSFNVNKPPKRKRKHTGAKRRLKTASR